MFTDVHGRVIPGSGRPKVPEADPDPPPAKFAPGGGGRMDYGYFMGWISDAERARRAAAAQARIHPNQPA